MDEFKYAFGTNVKLIAAGQPGMVIGRAEFQHNENSYLVRYKNAAGDQVENWWAESAITG